MRKPPAEIVASLLAATTVLISLPPYHLPPWAIFIGWAGTFAMGGPTKENLKRIWLVMPIGSIAAFLIVLGFIQASQYFSAGDDCTGTQESKEGRRRGYLRKCGRRENAVYGRDV
jgi:energy-coupling factor transporter transmembrane protein EcfT